jgi:hypothetical protein
MRSQWRNLDQKPDAGSKAAISKVEPSAHALRVRDNLAIISCFDFGAHLRRAALINPPSKFFLAGAGLSSCHRIHLISAESLHFTLGKVSQEPAAISL